VDEEAVMRKKILVVDDDTAVRESLMNALSYEDFFPLGAENGDQAVRLVETQTPDLVLLDLNMPGKSGWQVFQEISAARPLLPVVVLTARTNQLFTSLGAGVGALIEKPFDFLKLLHAVRGLLNETSEERLARMSGQSASFQYLRPNGNDITYAHSCKAEGIAN
jgi:DNA-binding response OmpR family regulator